MEDRSTDNFIDALEVSYAYNWGELEAEYAVKNVSFTLGKGEHLAILGRNGSGKSTLARLLNGLLIPRAGQVYVLGADTMDEALIWEIRRNLGMIFQNPDNQIVGTTVEEDVAFGPENLSMPREEMLRVVPDVLRQVGLSGFEKRQPAELSGGQKQKLAIAGILAMQPRCIIMDEATAMLDPQSRHELLDLIEQLRQVHGLSVINVTHHMDEVLCADRVLVMSRGELVLQGTPAQIFWEQEKIKALGLDLPSYMQITKRFLEALGQPVCREDLATEAAAVNKLVDVLRSGDREIFESALTKLVVDTMPEQPNYSEEPQTILTVEHLSYVYNEKLPNALQALKDVSFSLKRGEFLGIAGHTGSGKSTLIQHLNGLITLQRGRINVLGLDASDRKNIKAIRQKVGMVFQYPEQQLFAETIMQDVMYGPKHMGMTDEEARASAIEALTLVGMQSVDYAKSPFELSGGQMRRVAIAGILAMKPEILILDEPAAGLDPQGREEIFATLKLLQGRGVAIILVSHSMDDLSKLVDRILIMREGRLQTVQSVRGVFSQPDLVIDNNLELPSIMAFLNQVHVKITEVDALAFTEDDAIHKLLRAGAESAKKRASLGEEVPRR